MNVKVLVAFAVSMIVTLSGHLPGKCTELASLIGAGDPTETIGKRSFLVHVPLSLASSPGARPRVQCPLVVLLHGAHGTSALMANKTKMNSVADANKFIVVYPQGKNKMWHWGPRQDEGSYDSSDADDVGFISAILDYMQAKYNTDPKRVYVGGFSEGGFMTHRLTYSLSNKITAALMVSSALPRVMPETYGSTPPLPVMIILGTEDPEMPYDGGANPQNVVVDSGPTTVEKWVAANHCDNTPTVTRLPNISPPGVDPLLFSYSSLDHKHDVEFYRVKRGGHEWPGGNAGYAKNKDGNPCNDFSASEAFWAFASRSRK